MWEGDKYYNSYRRGVPAKKKRKVAAKSSEL